MSILVQTRSEEEEKAVLAFLNSLDIEYHTDSEEELSESFIKEYNQALDKADQEIESGNFLDQKNVEAFFEKKRRDL